MMTASKPRPKPTSCPRCGQRKRRDRQYCSRACAYGPPTERFWAKVDRRGSDDCWEWTASRKNNRGSFWLNGINRVAHRVSWEMHHGEIPSGLFVCHHCDNPICVNPAHLFLGSHADNMADCKRKGRIRNYRGPRGSKNHNAKLTEDVVVEIVTLAQSGTMPQKAIAQRYGVSDTTVSALVLGRTWKHVTEELVGSK